MHDSRFARINESVAQLGCRGLLRFQLHYRSRLCACPDRGPLLEGGLWRADLVGGKHFGRANGRLASAKRLAQLTNELYIQLGFYIYYVFYLGCQLSSKLMISTYIQ